MASGDSAFCGVGIDNANFQARTCWSAARCTPAAEPLHVRGVMSPHVSVSRNATNERRRPPGWRLPWMAQNLLTFNNKFAGLLPRKLAFSHELRGKCSTPRPAGPKTLTQCDHERERQRFHHRGEWLCRLSGRAQIDRGRLFRPRAGARDQSARASRRAGSGVHRRRPPHNSDRPRGWPACATSFTSPPTIACGRATPARSSPSMSTARAS